MDFNLVFEIKQGEDGKRLTTTIYQRGTDGKWSPADLTGCSATIRVSLKDSAVYIIDAAMTVNADQLNNKGQIYYDTTLAQGNNAVGDYELDIQVRDPFGVKLEYPLTDDENFGVFRIRKSKFGA